MINYNQKKIRILLEKGFSAEELRQLCQYEDDFKPLFNQLAPNSPKNEIIDKIIEYTDHKLIFESLLGWAKRHNPNRYRMYEPYQKGKSNDSGQKETSSDKPYDESTEQSKNNDGSGNGKKKTLKDKLFDILRDPFWQGVGGVIALLSLGFAIYTFLSSNQPPAPTPTSVAFVTDTPTPPNSTSEPPTATFTPPPTPTPLPPTITAPDGATMLLIPAGPFKMGSDNGTDDEKPVHTVILDAFYLDQTEVTNAQYARCVAAGGCTPPAQTSSYTRKSYYGNTDFDNYPVIYVNWEEAKTYCEWREARLPSEAEWEKAARGTDGRIYPWGDKFDGRKLNFCDKNCSLEWANKDFDDGYADTAPVGHYPQGASPYGVYDLVGNVREWVADWYGRYQAEAQTNPTGPTSGSNRVLRGGAWYNYAYITRASYRFNYEPTNADSIIGFRCAR